MYFSTGGDVPTELEAAWHPAVPEQLAAVWCHLSPHVRETILMLIDADLQRKAD